MKKMIMNNSIPFMTASSAIQSLMNLHFSKIILKLIYIHLKKKIKNRTKIMRQRIVKIN